uniref:DUF3752 domain-containing protein n=1 Tax=Caenorhabditis tropicalis TaxID=1561998 RepID=A0A1I7UKJ9_9PELO
MSYGPQLPAWLSKNQETEEAEKNDEEQSAMTYGPVIPSLSEKEEKPEEPEFYGPVIPGREVQKKESDEEDEEDAANSYGPSIPSNFRPGPSLPAADDSDEDIGPMPVSAGNEEKEAIERAYRIVLQKEAEDEEKNYVPKREEWMTSVPQKLGNFGLGARTFKKGTASERDSTWEDAPGAKKKRKEEMKTAKSVGLAAADARQAAIVEQKAAGPSLLELHQKKREEKVKEDVAGERRPFDREKDMEVRGLKPGGSKEAVDRMKEFQGRFANSKEQRFL